MADEFKKDQGIDLRKDKQAMQRLREAAEKAKIELSNVVQTIINLPFITADAEGPKHLDVSLTRAKFEELTRDLVERTEEPFKRALTDAGIKAEDDRRDHPGRRLDPHAGRAGTGQAARRRQGAEPERQPG